MQKILSYMRKAIEEFDMIQEGDKIAIGLSGGKDSLTLLLALHKLKTFFNKNFEILAISIDPGFDTFNVDYCTNLCNELGVTYIVKKTDIKEIVFDIREEKNPCSLCANLRRGILNSVAIENNCNKIALGHNQDDVLETFLLNLLYTGSIHTFSPKTFMDRSEVTLIRPLVFTNEKYIRSFVKKNNIITMNKCCPMDGFSKREDMKTLIKTLTLSIPTVRANLFGAIKRSSIQGWTKDN